MKTFLKSFSYAASGLKHFIIHERNAKIQLGFLCIAVILGLWFKITQSEWLVIILFGSLVLALELCNSALEKTLDLIHPGQHEMVKQAKDLMAGAVLLASIGAFIGGVIIFLPYLITLLAQ